MLISCIQVRDASKFDAGNIDPQKQASVRFGRPNIPEILKDMARVAATKRPQASRPLQTCTYRVLNPSIIALLATLSLLLTFRLDTGVSFTYGTQCAGFGPDLWP